MFRRKIVIHTIIAVISFIVLSGVQFFLLYNTYELKNEHYALASKSAIEQAYGASIKNDKLFPGGAAIIEHYVNRYMDPLERAAAQGVEGFKRLRQEVVDSIVLELRKKNNLDSVLAPVTKNNPRIGAIQYSLYLSLLDISFATDQYLPLYSPTEYNPNIAGDLQMGSGVQIGGTLQHPTPKNLIVEITVASGSAHSYRARFALFADTSERRSDIIKLMLPTFLLSLLSILSVMGISFLAFWNWARQKNISEMKSDFINSITHEFNTPLATIILANRTLQNKMVTTSVEQIDPIAAVIERQTRRLTTMIGRVLDITTINRIVPVRKSVSVHSMLEEILEDYDIKQTINHSGIVLHKNAQSDLIMADPFWFTTIIVNILDNAVKYNDKPHKEITVTTYNIRKLVVVEVQDNGPGMDLQTRKHIFDKFYRAPEQVKKESKGLGLGLYYVQKAVEAHHWKIDVGSDPGQGSIFSISIPLSL